MANAKHEDAVMKMGFDYFRNTILKTLGIDYQYEEIGPTELVELTIQSLYMDFTFLTTGGFYIHTEFQTCKHCRETFQAVFSFCDYECEI